MGTVKEDHGICRRGGRPETPRTDASHLAYQSVDTLGQVLLMMVEALVSGELDHHIGDREKGLLRKDVLLSERPPSSCPATGMPLKTRTGWVR